MIILGINAYHGDAAAALVKDGELVAAVEEERFNRIKHCAGFPAQSIQYCLRAAGITVRELDHVGISRKPSAHAHKRIFALAKGNGRTRRQSFDLANNINARAAASPAFAPVAAASRPELSPDANLFVDEPLESNG